MKLIMMKSIFISNIFAVSISLHFCKQNAQGNAFQANDLVMSVMCNRKTTRPRDKA